MHSIRALVNINSLASCCSFFWLFSNLCALFYFIFFVSNTNFVFNDEIFKNGVSTTVDSSQTTTTTTTTSDVTKPIKERGNWGNDIEFLMSCIAMSVGLGNIWRVSCLDALSIIY